MQQIIYISTPKSQEIHVLKMNNQGLLTLLQVINTPGQGQPIAIHPVKMYLYIGIRPTYGVVSYRIDKWGMLTEMDVTPLSSSPTYLEVDLRNEILYCVSYNGSCLNVIPIDKGIASEPIQTLEGLFNCHSVNVDVINRILWVPCLKEDRIRLYHIDQLGFLTPCTPAVINSSASGAGPRHMVFHPNGNYAYIINELNGTIDVVAINFSDVNPHIVQTLGIMPANFNTAPWASDIHVTPNGLWLYCCDRNTSMISRFAILKGGKELRLLGHHATETQPRAFNIDIQGRFLVSAGQKSNYIMVYSILPKLGELIPLKRYKVGQDPMWISIFTIKSESSRL